MRYFLNNAAPRILMLGAMVVFATAAFGQSYPVKHIRLVTAETGGGNDFIARVIAQVMSESLGQQVIVDNRGGGAGLIASDVVAKSPADGYTLLQYSASMWVVPLLLSHAPYDPVRDFAPVSTVARSPSLVVVNPSTPIRSIAELITVARAKPGSLNYGSAGTGATTHLGPELFKAMAGVDIVRVPYKGDSLAVIDLLGGRIQVMFATAGSVVQHVRSGKLRALAVTSPQPSPLVPGLPTVASAGLPGYESVSLYGVFAPAATPRPIVERLNREIALALRRADVKEKFTSRVVEPAGTSPAEFSALMKADIARTGKLIRDAGIRDEG